MNVAGGAAQVALRVRSNRHPVGDSCWAARLFGCSRASVCALTVEWPKSLYVRFLSP